TTWIPELRFGILEPPRMSRPERVAVDKRPAVRLVPARPDTLCIVHRRPPPIGTHRRASRACAGSRKASRGVLLPDECQSSSHRGSAESRTVAPPRSGRIHRSRRRTDARREGGRASDHPPERELGSARGPPPSQDRQLPLRRLLVRPPPDL